MAKDYAKLEKAELIQIIKKLEGRKKYGLVWDEERVKEKFEKDSENALPILKEVRSRDILTDEQQPFHILIEGENYHVLSVLNYTHQGRVDLIYIDPPFNTGSTSWIYNNKYVDKEDAYRHSKWVSFMSKRLRLAKNLLKEDGIIVVAIDDNELFNLGMLMDEIFGEENHLGNIAIVNKKSGRTTDKFFATCHEYNLVYAQNKDLALIGELLISATEKDKFPYEDAVSRYRWRDFLRTGGYSTPEERPNSYYPIYYDERQKIISIDSIPNSVAIWPIDTRGQKRVWRRTKPTLVQDIANGDIEVRKQNNGSYSVKIKERVKTSKKPKTVWDDPKYDASSHGTKLLANIMGNPNTFDYPKSLYAVKDILSVTSPNKKNAVILDFFAGSGTTGHAVLEMNKEDGGERQFILCTDNQDNNGSGLKIATDICYPRIQKVMKGYTKEGNGTKVERLGGNLNYFKTAFVKKSVNKDEFKFRITQECTEMLCLREGIFQEKKQNHYYRIFEQGGRIMAVYYSLNRSGLPKLKKELDKMQSEKILYCFTLDPLGLAKKDFVGWSDVTLEPIPQKILEVYQQIYEH